MDISHPRGASLIGKSVQDFFRTKGFIRIFDGFFLKTKGFLPNVYEIFGSEMPLALIYEQLHFLESIRGILYDLIKVLGPFSVILQP